MIFGKPLRGAMGVVGLLLAGASGLVASGARAAPAAGAAQTGAPPHLGTTGHAQGRTSAPPRLGTTGRTPGSGLDTGVGSGAGSTSQRGGRGK